MDVLACTKISQQLFFVIQVLYVLCVWVLLCAGESPSHKKVRRECIAASSLQLYPCCARMCLAVSVQTIDEQEVCRTSRINLVDLAGSERTGKAGTTGDRLKVRVTASLPNSLL